MRLEQGAYSEAVENYNAALSLIEKVSRLANRRHLDPKRAIGLMNRAIVRQNLGDVAGAVEDFSAAVDLLDSRPGLVPARAVALRNRGFARQALGDQNDALADLNAALQLYGIEKSWRETNEDDISLMKEAECALTVGGGQFDLAASLRAEGITRERLELSRHRANEIAERIRRREALFSRFGVRVLVDELARTVVSVGVHALSEIQDALSPPALGFRVGSREGGENFETLFADSEISVWPRSCTRLDNGDVEISIQYLKRLPRGEQNVTVYVDDRDFSSRITKDHTFQQRRIRNLTVSGVDRELADLALTDAPDRLIINLTTKQS